MTSRAAGSRRNPPPQRARLQKAGSLQTAKVATLRAGECSAFGPAEDSRANAADQMSGRTPSLHSGQSSISMSLTARQSLQVQ
jgi:hypothetical protein